MEKSLLQRMYTAIVTRDAENVKTVGRLLEGDHAAKLALGRMTHEVLYRLAIRRFGDAPSLAELDTFLAVPRPLPREEPVSLIDAEAVLRAILGEDDLVRGMDAMLKHGVALVLAVFVNDDLQLSTAALDELLADAERAVAETPGAPPRI